MTVSMYDAAAFLVPFILGIVWPLLHHQKVDSAKGPVPRWVTTVFWVSLVVAIATLQLAQHYFATVLRGTVVGLPVNVGSDVLFPLTLAVLLYLCVVRRPPEFKSVYRVVLVVNASVAAWSWWAGHPEYSHYSATHRLAGLWSENAPWKILLGGALTVFDAALMILVYRWASYHTVYRGARILVPLLAGLWCDAVVYSLIETACGPTPSLDTWGTELFGQLVAKSLAGGVYSTLIYLYLKHSSRIFDPKQMMATRDFVRRVTPALVWFALEHADSSGRLKGIRLPLDPAKRSGTTEVRRASSSWNGDAEPSSAVQVALTDSSSDGTTAGRMDATIDLTRPLLTASARIEADWPGLLRAMPGRWVAYTDQGRVAEGDSYRHLTQTLCAAGIEGHECVIRHVVAPLPAVGVHELVLPPGPDLPPDDEGLPEEVVRVNAARRRLMVDEAALRAEHAGAWVVYDMNGLVTVSSDYRKIPLEIRERADVVIEQLVG